MGFAQDMKEFSAGFGSGMKFGADIKERRLQREDKALDRQERRFNRQQDIEHRDRVFDENKRRYEGPGDPGGAEEIKRKYQGSSTDIPGSAKERGSQAVQHFVGLGYTKEAASGIVGNLYQESGVNPRTRPGDKGTAHGIAQWRGDRWANMQKFARSRGTDPYDFKTQLDFIDYELGTSNGGNIRNRLMKTSDITAAADLFALKFERPQGAQTGRASNIHGIGTRRQMASNFFNSAGGTSGTGTIASTGGPPLPPRRPNTMEAGAVPQTVASAEPAEEPQTDPGSGEVAESPAPIQSAELEVPIDPETGLPLDPFALDLEAPVVTARNGGAIPTRRFADAGGVDPYNRYRAYTQVPVAPKPVKGAKATTAFTPRRVGQAAPETSIPVTPLPKPVVAKKVVKPAIAPPGDAYWRPKYGTAPKVQGFGNAALDRMTDVQLSNFINRSAGGSGQPGNFAYQQAGNNSMAMTGKAGSGPAEWAFGIGTKFTPQQRDQIADYARWRLGERGYGAAAGEATRQVSLAQAAQQNLFAQMERERGGMREEGGPIVPGMNAAIPTRRMAAGGNPAVKPKLETIAPTKLQGPAPGGSTYVPRGPKEVGFGMNQISPAQANARAARAQLAEDRRLNPPEDPGAAASTPMVPGMFGVGGMQVPGMISSTAYGPQMMPTVPSSPVGPTMAAAPRQLYARGGAVDDDAGKAKQRISQRQAMVRGGSESQGGGGGATRGMRLANPTEADAKRAGLTVGDIQRMNSDPSRYGAIYVPDEGGAIPARERTRRPSGAKKGKAEPKEPGTTGSTTSRERAPQVGQEDFEDQRGQRGPQATDPGMRRPYDSADDPDALTPTFTPADPRLPTIPVTPGGPPAPQTPALSRAYEGSTARQLGEAIRETPSGSTGPQWNPGQAYDEPPLVSPTGQLTEPPIPTFRVRSRGYARGGGVESQDENVYEALDNYAQQNPTPGEAPAPLPGRAGAQPFRGDPQATGALPPRGQAQPAPALQAQAGPGATAVPDEQDQIRERLGRISKEEQQRIINPDGSGISPAAGPMKRGLDLFEQILRGGGGRTAEQPGPAIGVDPRETERGGAAARAYATRTDRDTEDVPTMTPQEYREAAKAVDPEGKLGTAEKNILMYQELQDYWLAQGNPRKAAEAALGLTLYNKKFTQTAGTMAGAAFEDGNISKGLEWLDKGFDHIPDNRDLQYKINPDGTVAYKIVDKGENQVVSEGIAGPAELKALAVQAQTGKMFDDEMMRITSELRTGQRGGRAAAKDKGPSEGDIRRQHLQETEDDVAAGVASKDPAILEKRADAIRRREGEGKNADDAIRRMYIRSGVDLPPELQDKPKEGTMTERQSRERKAWFTEQNKLAEAEQDPAKRRAIKNGIATRAWNDVKDKNVPDDSKIDEAIEVEKIDDPEGAFASMAQEVLRKNEMTPRMAVKAIKALTTGEGGTFDSEGRIKVPNFHRPFFIDPAFLPQLKKLRAPAPAG